MADMHSQSTNSHRDQTTVLAGPGRGVSLDACARQIMAQAGLTCLLDTKLSFIGDHGSAVEVSVSPDLDRVSVVGKAPAEAKWLVVEQLADGGASRAWAFCSREGAAAHFGVKLVMQERGAVTVEHGNQSHEPTVRFKGQGRSGIAALIMTSLSA